MTLDPQPSTLNHFRHRWLFDWASPWEYSAHAVRHEIYHAPSAHHDIEIVETEGYGRCLLLDGEVQSFQADEHIYHESLVHPALLLVPEPGPRRVLIIGGGEGATLREVLRYASVEQVTMVDIDPLLNVVAREHLPSFHAGSFNDHRVRLEFCNGRTFIELTQECFDAIVIDVTNPMQGGPSVRLFTVEFYRSVRERLRAGGVVAVQSDAVTLHALDGSATIQHTMRQVWPHVFSCVVFLPAYTTEWSFTLAGTELSAPLVLSSEAIDERLKSRSVMNLRFYDGVAHQRMFRLPRYVREAYAAAQLVNRDARPMTESFPGFRQ